MYEDWADMTFQPDWSKAAEDVEVRGDSTRSVHGRRQRLQASHPGTQVLCDSLGNLGGFDLQGAGPIACMVHCHGVWAAPAQEVPMESSKPLPCVGKVVVRYKGRSAEARLTLPAPGTRAACAEELPDVGWLTVGLLATDGFALQVWPFSCSIPGITVVGLDSGAPRQQFLGMQLRLHRADRPAVRDMQRGTWLAYHAVGGAVTLVNNEGGCPALVPVPGPLAF